VLAAAVEVRMNATRPARVPRKVVAREPGITPASEMETEALARFVADAFTKLKSALPYIAELRERFAKLPRGKANVMGCRTWTQFCERVLHRTDSAVRKLLAADYVTKTERKEFADWERKQKEIEKEERRQWRDQKRERQAEFEALPEEEKARIRVEAERKKQEEEERVRDFNRELTEAFGNTNVPARLKPTASEIIEAGYRALAKTRHPDVGGTQDQMVLLNETIPYLRKLFQ
jgi:hypothetical protein